MTELEALQREFDEAFAGAIAPDEPGATQYLTLRVGQQRIAVRVADLSGVRRASPITALPGSGARCLGLALVDGRIVRVHTSGCDEPRFFVLRDAAALAVDELCDVVVAQEDVDWVPTQSGRVERIAAADLFEGK